MTTSTYTFTPARPGAPDRSDDDRARSAARLARAGGVAALAKAATYVLGLGVMGAFLVPAGFGEGGPADEVAFLVEHQAVLAAWYGTLYLLGGVALVVLVVALHARLRGADHGARTVTTAFGVIWSGLLLASGMVALVGQQAVVELHRTEPDRAATVLQSVSIVQDALGGGIELVGALWVLGVSALAATVGAFGRRVHLLGYLIGVAGVLTVVPALAGLGAAFGLGFIAWFGCIAVDLLRR